MSESRPGPITRVKNLTKAMLSAGKYLISEGHVLCDEKTTLDRLKVCETCPEYGKYVEDECGECGCPVKARKALLESACCPRSWWDNDMTKVGLGLCEENKQEEVKK